MTNQRSRTLLVVVAHPDDESFGSGAHIASAAADGANVIVCCASRGELGEDITGRYPNRSALAAAREAELLGSARELGAAGVELLDLSDSGWDGDPPAGSIVTEPKLLASRLDDVIRRYRPDITVTLDPTGSDGHRDHAAVGRATTESFDRVVDWPATLYHWCLPHSLMDAWVREIAEADPDSVYLGTDLGRADVDVTTILDGEAVLAQTWRAIGMHQTQASPYASISQELAERFVRYDHLVLHRELPATRARSRVERSLRWPDQIPAAT